MITNEIAIELAQLGLNIEKTRATVAAENIAFKNIRQTSLVVDFDGLISNISDKLALEDLSAAKRIIQQQSRATSEYVDISNTTISLDSQITDLSSATGRYKVISESLSRKFGLMSLAVTGR